MMKIKNSRWRHYFVIGLFFLCILGLVWRLVFLTILDRDFLTSQGDARTIRLLRIPAYRGMITDRNGEPLAISTPMNSVWIDPRKFQLEHPGSLKLRRWLSLKPGTLKERLETGKGREFAYLKRGVDPETAAKIKALDIPGVYLQHEFRRFYPEGAVTSHLLGFTNIDDHGQEGIELAFDQWLRGRAGKRRVLKDRLGRVVENIDMISESRPGHNLALSIDRRIQYLAYRALRDAVNKYKATSGSVVVLNIPTGEILAMVNEPTYNPNDKRKPGQSNLYRNRAVTDVFEPGSVIKTFSMVTALNSGKYKANTVLNTHPGWMKIGKNVVRDIRDHGRLSLNDVLKYSSNVGISKLVLSLPARNLWQTLNQVGFGQRTNSGFPGESAGSLPNHLRWRPFEVATLAFGYGIAATPLQLAQAYAILASGGIKRPVTLLRQTKAPKQEQVLDPIVANKVLNMLVNVVEGKKGTGGRAKLRNYHVAGKTGTARMLGAEGYEKNHHIASFAGIAPATKPRLVVVVVVTDPQEKAYYGSVVAAPVFAKVMQGALRVLQVPPDKLS